MYEPGAHIDLRHLNGGAVSAASKSETQQRAYDVGTHFAFQFEAGKIKVARTIPVVFA